MLKLQSRVQFARAKVILFALFPMVGPWSSSGHCSSERDAGRLERVRRAMSTVQALKNMS